MSGSYSGSMWILGGFAVVAGLMTLAVRAMSTTIAGNKANPSLRSG
jgi:hypothetical protein